MNFATVDIDDELLRAAEEAGRASGRSAEEQLSHWARIGRNLLASPSVRTHATAAALTYPNAYDTLGELEQAIVRAVWDEQARKRNRGA